MSTEQTKTVQQLETTDRVITVISTRGEKKKIIYNGTTWKGLKEEVIKAGYNLKNMKCVEGINKHTLEHPDALVPDGNFALFLMPLESKSGGLTRPEIYEFIRQAIEKNPDLAKAHFNEGGNYTRKSTSVLSDLVETYLPGIKKEKKKTRTVATNDAVTNTVAAVATGTDEEKEDALGDISKMSTEEKLNFLITLALALKVDIEALKNGAVGGIVAGLQAAATVAEEPKETEDERIAREKREAEQAEADRLRAEQEEKDRLQKEADEKETAELLAQMNGMKSGFDDVKRF